MEEAKRRDHNKLGREMKIFTTVDVIGQGPVSYTHLIPGEARHPARLP